MRKKTLSTKMILSAALLLTLGAGEAMAQKRAFAIEDVYRSAPQS